MLIFLSSINTVTIDYYLYYHCPYYSIPYCYRHRIVIDVRLSIYSIPSRGHPFMTSTTEGEGGQAQVDACGLGEGGEAPCGRPHRKLKL